MSFVTPLIHSALAAGRVTLPHGHRTSIRQHGKAVLASGDSEHGNDQSREMIWRREGKKKRKNNKEKKKRGRRLAGVGGMESVGVADGGDSPLHLASATRGFLALWHWGFEHGKISGVFEMLGEPGQLKITRLSDPSLLTLGSAARRWQASKGWRLRSVPMGRGSMTGTHQGTPKVLLSFDPVWLLWAEQALKTLKALFNIKHLCNFLVEISCGN